MQTIIRRCVLAVLLAAALALLFAVPDERLPMPAWVTLTLLSKIGGILLFAFILSPRVLSCTTKNT